MMRASVHQAAPREKVASAAHSAKVRPLAAADGSALWAARPAREAFRGDPKQSKSEARKR